MFSKNDKYNDKYNDILLNYQTIIENYIKLNNITIKTDIHDLSYQLLLILLTYSRCNLTFLYSYDELKNKIHI